MRFITHHAFIVEVFVVAIITGSCWIEVIITKTIKWIIFFFIIFFKWVCYFTCAINDVV